MFDLIGLSKQRVSVIMTWTLLFSASLIIVDSLGIASWPKWMNTQNSRCYIEMFSEPKRSGQWIGHFGNALSNSVYLFDAICVLSACSSSPMLAGDAMFGATLLSLSIFSFVWHASNAPRSHYIDLLVMDQNIVYLQIRYFCIPFALHFGERLNVILSLLFMARNGWIRCSNLKKKEFDDFCPFSGRNRLHHKRDIDVHGICLFLSMPIVFFVSPCIVMLYMGSLGHIPSSTVTITSLSIGWSIRMFERFVLDGWPPSNRWKHNVLMAALVSPTAIFHVLTGMTLIAGYAHSRSLDKHFVENKIDFDV